MQIQGLADASLNTQQDALECFWEGQHWKDILVWSQKYPEASEGQWQTVADFMVSIDATNNPSEAIAHLFKFARFLHSLPSLASTRNDPTWQVVFERYGKGIEDALAKADNFPINSDRLQLWQKGLANLVKAGFARDCNFALAARCAYLDGDYQKAIAFWEKCQQTSYCNCNEYFLSKAAIASIPEKIRWFSRAQQPARIVEVWQSKKHALSDEWKPYKEVCELARSRWLEIKRRQANYSEQRGKIDVARRQRQEAEHFEQMWQGNSIDALRQRLRARLENLSEDELKQVDRYILFLEFSRGLKCDRND